MYGAPELALRAPRVIFAVLAVDAAILVEVVALKNGLDLLLAFGECNL